MMKFGYFLFCLLAIITLPQENFYCNAASENSTYAKASSNCVLYKTEDMSDNLDNIYFVIPETYFVTVLDVVTDNCMRVQYGKFTGFIKSSNVVIASFIPKVTSGTQVWSQPSTSSKVLTTISAGVKNIEYIAFSYGDIPSGGESNLWYYVTYTPVSNSTSVYEGYVYSENVTNLSEIPVNIESNPETEVINNDGDAMIVISSSIRTLLIALISIPIIIFLVIILYKIVKKVRENTNKNKNFNESAVENFTENERYSPAQHHSSNLKNQIVNLKNNTFVRKNRSSSENEYPAFPSYDADDDML